MTFESRLELVEALVLPQLPAKLREFLPYGSYLGAPWMPFQAGGPHRLQVEPRWDSDTGQIVFRFVLDNAQTDLAIVGKVKSAEI